MLTMSLLGLYKDPHVSLKSLLKRSGGDETFLEFLFPGVKLVISGQRAQPKSKPPKAKASAGGSWAGGSGAGEGQEEGEGGGGGGEGSKGAAPTTAAGMGWATVGPAEEDEKQRQESVAHYLPLFAAAAAAAACAASTAAAASGELRKGGKSTADSTRGLPSSSLESCGGMRCGGQAGPRAPQVERAWPSSAAELERGVNDTWNAFQTLMKGRSVTIQQWKAARTSLWEAAAAVADVGVEEEEVMLPWPSSAAELRRGANDTWNAFQVLTKGFMV